MVYGLTLLPGLCLIMEKDAVQDRLSSLKTGEAAAVVSIKAAQTAAKRLADMGFVRGAVVEMIRPGKACLVRISGTCVGLGVEHQRNIVVHRA